MFNPITILLKKQELLIKIIAATVLLVSTIGLLSQTASAQSTYVITDGENVMVHTTYETDPVQILSEAGLALDSDDTYTTQEGFGIAEIKVRRSQTIHIDNCGSQTQIITYGETVGDLLNRLDIPMDGDTQVSVPLETLTYDGMELEINRTVRNTEVYTAAIPHDTIYVHDSSLPAGVEQVLTEGVDYEITGDVCFFEAGTYSCTITGMYQYAGSVTCEYTVKTNDCSHTGGSATCCERAVCDLCGRHYGEVDTEAHSFENGSCILCGAQDTTRVPGDIDGSGTVDVDDVLALLWYVLFPEDYPIDAEADFDHNGSTDVDDVLTLLWYVLFPEDYPLN